MKEMPRLRSTKKRGSLLLDTLTALFVLSMGALSLFATLPVASKAGKLASDQGQASYMATKYIEQLQTLKTTDITLNKLTSLNLIDAGQTGSSPYTFTNVPLDNGSYYSPSKVLKGAAATITITNLDSGAVKCDISIQWKSANGIQESLSTGTVVGGYK